MRSKIIEATNADGGGFNWGKFLVVQLDKKEWNVKSALPLEGECAEVQNRYPLLHLIGYSAQNVIVFDLQTREGAAFVPRITAPADMDLGERKIWCCPMYEPFLRWLYKQDTKDVRKLPSIVFLEASSEFRGYRRQGEQHYSDGSGI